MVVFAVIWLVTIFISIGLEKYRKSLLIKDLADLKLKFNENKSQEYTNNNLMLCVLGFNIIDQLFDINKYIHNKDSVISNLTSLNLLNNMSEEEILYYEKKPSILRAHKMYNKYIIEEYLLKKKQDTLREEIKLDKKSEFIITYNFFEEGENQISFYSKKPYKIVKVSGPIKDKSKHIQRLKIYSLIDNISNYYMDNYKNEEDLEKLSENLSISDINSILCESSESIEGKWVLRKDLRKRK